MMVGRGRGAGGRPRRDSSGRQEGRWSPSRRQTLNHHQPCPRLAMSRSQDLIDSLPYIDRDLEDVPGESPELGRVLLSPSPLLTNLPRRELTP